MPCGFSQINLWNEWSLLPIILLAVDGMPLHVFCLFFWGVRGQTAVTAKFELHSLQPNFHFSFRGRGVRLQSLQSWTALTAAQLPLLILGGVRLQSLQSWTALTAAQLPLLILGGGGVGLQSLHNKVQSFQFCIFSIKMKYLMHSLLIKKYFQKQN